MSAGLQQKGIKLTLRIFGSAKLDAIRCWRASLIVAELITNACRHAFKASGDQILVEVEEAGPALNAWSVTTGPQRQIPDWELGRTSLTD